MKEWFIVWYRDPRDVITQELRIAGLEASVDETQKIVWDCLITPGMMFREALAAKV